MSPKRRREENRGLPARWRYKNGAYYYRVPEGLEGQWEGRTEFRLGKTLTEAYQVWAKRLELYSDARSIAEGLDRYLYEVVPTKAPRTQQTELPVIRNLKAGFGHMPIVSLRPCDVYAMKDKLGVRSQAQANRHIAVLSHAYTKFIEWGLTDNHPIKQKVIKYGYKPRDRYVEDWELLEFLSVAPDLILAYCPIKLITGLRKGDILSITLQCLQDDGMKVYNSKTKKWMLFEWSDELLQAVDNIKALRRKITSVYLFHTNRGQPYVKEDRTTSGFDSIWNRAMSKALERTKLKNRFTEHDLRAKVGSDVESDERAQQLLNHSSIALTKRVYRRKPNKVKPHNWRMPT